jgi:hypothetical protein
MHIGECRGTWKPVGSGFYSLFLHCLRAEMPFRCKQAFPREERCLLDLLRSVLHLNERKKKKPCSLGFVLLCSVCF